MWMFRSRWHPVALRSTDVLMITYALMMATLIRAYDYGTGAEAEGVGPILRPAEAFMPMWAWAGAFGLGALVLAVGVVAKRHFVVWVGHGLLIFPYGGLAIGVLCGAAFAPWGDGVRAMASLGVMALLHILLWMRTGPRPLDPKHSQPVEVITAGGDDG